MRKASKDAVQVQFPDGTTRNGRGMKRLDEKIGEHAAKGFTAERASSILGAIPQREQESVMLCVEIAAGKKVSDPGEWLQKFILSAALVRRRDPLELVRDIEHSGSIVGILIARKHLQPRTVADSQESRCA